MILTQKRRLQRTAWSLKLKCPRPKTSSDYAWLAAVAYGAVLLFLAVGPLFRARFFDCQTNMGDPCPDFVIPELKKSFGQLVFLVQTDQLAARIKANIPQSEHVAVTPRWPNIIAATITWQPGFVNLSIPASSSAFLVGADRQIIKVLAEPDRNLPVIVASSAADLIISDTLTDPSLVAAFDILHACKDSSITINRIDVVTVQDIRVTMDNDKIAVFTGLTSIKDQVLRLQLILSQTTINSERPIIDVRYDRPTLKQSL